MNVYIATPSFSQSVCVEYTLSLIQTIDQLSRKEIGYGVSIIPGDCFIANVRNRLITEFLKTPCTDLFFVDDDVQWKAEDFIRVLEAPFDVVGGIYPQKLDVIPQRFPVELACDEDRALIVSEHANGLTYYKANTLPAGFMRIRRHVIEEMVKQFPKTYGWPEVSGDIQFHHALFEAGVCFEEQKFHGEDYNFSMKLRSIGIDLWTLPNITFSHVGKKKYEGNLQVQIDKLAEETQHATN